jgi:type IV pilus assembly protein PilA
MFQARKLSSIVLALCFFAGALSALSCGKKSDDTTPATGTSAKASPASLPTAELKAALQAVPSNALGVVSMAFPMTLSDMSTGFGFVPFDPAVASEMQAALLEHSKTHLGIDASQVRSILVFADSAAEPSGAAIISPVEGTLKGEAITEENIRFVIIDREEQVVATQSGKTLLIGKMPSVKSALATMKSGDSLAKSDSAFAKLASEQVLASYFSVTADLSKLPLPKIPMTEGLSHAGARFATDGLHLAIHGKKETLEMLSSTAKGSLQMAINLAKANMESSRDDFAEGTAGIMGYYTAKNFGSLLEPVIEGERMTLDFAFEGGGSMPIIFVSVTGILAAVAIPAFMKYIKKSKASEASMFLRKLSDGARSFALETGSLPESVGPTPPLGSCCAQGEKCSPEAELWQHPTWQALNFAIDDPHYYSYEFVNHGASYELKAYGDLDCDGTYSTFVMPSGSGDDGSPTLYKENELE